MRARKSHSALTQSSTSSTGSELARKKEQRSVPWSILAILAVYLLTSLPWSVMQVFTVQVTEAIAAQGGPAATLFDLFYSVLQIAIGCSPLVYLLTTNSLRQVVKRTLFRSCP